MENSLGIPQKIKCRSMNNPAIPLLGTHPRYLKISGQKKGKKPYTNVYSSLIPSSQKVVTTQISINWLINKRWCIYVMDYYSAIKRTEILIHAAIWMNLGNTTKWKKPDPKAICCVTQFMWDVQNRHIYRDVKFPRAKEKGEWGNDCLIGLGFCLGWWECSGPR